MGTASKNEHVNACRTSLRDSFRGHIKLGEWRQKLDREGRPFTATVALPVKDLFHLPRVLILCIEVLERLLAADGAWADPAAAAYLRAADWAVFGRACPFAVM